MKYTANYNLYKPDYDDTIDVDFLNKNMDVLDNQLNGLDYVQNVNTSDKGLTFIKRNGDTIPVSLNYLPITGGNLTGEITVKERPLYYVIEDLIDDSSQNYTLRAVKYSDGSLKNVITLKRNIPISTITFLTPFIDINNVEAYSSRFALGSNGTELERVYSIAKLTTTSFETGNNAERSRQQTTILGRWK